MDRKTFDRLAEQGHARQRERLESNAEFQRRSAMTKEERARFAKERLIGALREHAARQGQDDSAAKAERKAEEIVGRFVREVEK